VFDGHTEGWGRDWASWPVTSIADDIEAIRRAGLHRVGRPQPAAIWLRWPPGPATARTWPPGCRSRGSDRQHLALLAERPGDGPKPGGRRRVRYRLHSAPMKVRSSSWPRWPRLGQPLDALKEHLDRGA